MRRHDPSAVGGSDIHHTARRVDELAVLVEHALGDAEIRRMGDRIRPDKQIVMEKATLAGVGELIFFKDSEGNVAGAMQYDAAAE